MDLSGFMALAEHCAPGVNARTLIPIVSASGLESLALTIGGRKPIKILATSTDEAIALAMQAKVAHSSVRLGIAGLTFEDLDKAEISVSDAFEACTSLRAAARIHGEAGRGTEQSDVSNEAAPAKRSVKRDSDADVDRSAQQAQTPVEQEQPLKESWDVFGKASSSSLLVYRASVSPRTRGD